MKAIEIKNLKKAYKNFTLNIEDLEVRRGFIMGFNICNSIILCIYWSKFNNNYRFIISYGNLLYYCFLWRKK